MKTCSTSQTRPDNIRICPEIATSGLAHIKARLHRLQTSMANLQIAITLSEAGDISGARAQIKKHDE